MNQRIIGIDPGLRITGYGLIDVDGPNRYHYVASGIIRTSGTELYERLRDIVMGIDQLFAQYHPTIAVIEKVFVNINPQSTLLLGQARGAALAAITRYEVPVHEYTALQLKKSIVGHGRASKDQVEHMVKRLLHLSGDLRPDAADALGVAICHAHCMYLIEQLNTRAPSSSTASVQRIRANRIQ